LVGWYADAIEIYGDAVSFTQSYIIFSMLSCPLNDNIALSYCILREKKFKLKNPMLRATFSIM
jgi:hypothetical protein